MMSFYILFYILYFLQALASPPICQEERVEVAGSLDEEVRNLSMSCNYIREALPSCTNDLILHNILHFIFSAGVRIAASLSGRKSGGGWQSG